MKSDVLIVGGGPAGTTIAALLKRYRPATTVRLIESSVFPRDHVGESQLPAVCGILNEMGVWDKVEACGFPIKTGARYRWGLTDELWDFNFLPNGVLAPESRPAQYGGQRLQTAFQVDRSIYDKVLLDHCRELGCDATEDTKGVQVEVAENRIEGVISARSSHDERERIEAKYYVDASASNLFRKALNIDVEAPTSLRNIAIWDYWQDAEWALEIGVGGTKVQIMSLGWGWIWFIPITPTRTSIGLVTSVEYYKGSGKTPKELYLTAIASEPLISRLTAQAVPEKRLQATKDWSYLANRLCGPNWFLAGDSCGFADPILSAGMTLAQQGARRVAFSILELLKGECDGNWITSSYQQVQSANIRNHIRFADYWYSANANFTDLKNYCSQIAADAGLNLDAEEAFQWLGTGGFANETIGLPGLGTFGVGGIKGMIHKMSGELSKWKIKEFNYFERRDEGAVEDSVPLYEKGSVRPVPCLRRGAKTLPFRLVYRYVWEALGKENEIIYLMERCIQQARLDRCAMPTPLLVRYSIETLEAMLVEGWVKASRREGLRFLDDSMVDRIGCG